MWNNDKPIKNRNKNKTTYRYRLVVARVGGLGVGEMGEGGQRVQTSSYKCHGDVMYSMVTIVNNTVLYI